MTSRTLPERVSLVLCDVDGTLVTRDKRLTPRTIEAVRALRARGIAFALASARPPGGLAAIIDALDVDLPCASFNGGYIADRSGQVIVQHLLDDPIPAQVSGLFAARGVDVWAFTPAHWYLSAATGAYVSLETRTVGFAPRVVADPLEAGGGFGKIVGVSEDVALLAEVEAQARALLGATANASRSQPYYLDVTAPQADKARALASLCRHLGVPIEETVAIGDGHNDVAMLRASGFGIAVANGAPEVRAAADYVTGSNEDDGVAQALALAMEAS